MHFAWIMRLKFKLEPAPYLEPEQGQSDGSGSSQIPRLLAAPAPKPWITLSLYTPLSAGDTVPLICCWQAFKWLPVLVISAILVWSYYAYVVHLCILTIESDPGKTGAYAQSPPPRLPPEWVCWTHLSVANKNYIIEVNIFRVFLFRRLFVFVSRIRHNNSDPSGSQSLFTFTSVSDPCWICFFRPSRSGSVFGIRIQFLSTTWIRIRFPNTVPDETDHHWIPYGSLSETMSPIHHFFTLQ